jgi:hypothetical protein
MTSLQTSVRQVSANSGYFIPLTDIRTMIYSVNNGTVAPATWANAPVGASQGVYSTLVAASGRSILRDMGKTVVSASRTFRKVQLVVSSASTFGVAGNAGVTAPATEWLTGYIELGFGSDGVSVHTPVAQYGR